MKQWKLFEKISLLCCIVFLAFAVLTIAAAVSYAMQGQNFLLVLPTVLWSAFSQGALAQFLFVSGIGWIAFLICRLAINLLEDRIR